jgi:RNA polymerase sigma factor (sigma-70 family)
MSQHLIVEDSELVVSLNRGEQAALESIYRKYAMMLLAFARRNIASREDCEEIIQDVFESLWKRRAQIVILELRPYLFKMVRYLIFLNIRKSKVKRKYEEHFMLFEAVFDQMAEEEDRNHDAVALQGLIENAIASLPSRCQAPIRLRLNENLSNADIAYRLNIKELPWSII